MGDRHRESILRLENVSLQGGIGSDLLLQNISCDFKQGEKIGIIGASGSGKTSLLRLCNRLASPSNGKVFMVGTSVRELSVTQLRQSIVLVPQEPKLLGMVVRETLAYPLRLQKLSEAEISSRIDTWVDLLNIESQWLRKTELQLSVGQRQLVAIARGLVMQPQVLLLDEPTSALDTGTASHLLGVLNNLNQSQNLTIVMVNHQLGLVKNFCDRLLFLDRGKLLEDTPANDTNWKLLEQRLMQSSLVQEEEWG